MHRDLTAGSVTKNLLSMSLPTMFGFMSQTLYDLVDMAWIGRISPEAVASVTIFTTIFWLAEVMNEIIGTGSVSLISQSYGSGDTERTRRVIEQTIAFKALVALISATFLLLFLKPLIAFFTDDPLVRRSALEYGYIRIFFLPIMFSSYTVNTALRCTGDAKKPMIIMLTASVLNVVLDPVLMFDTIPGTPIHGFGLGVFGAALATIISITVAFLAGFCILFSRWARVRITLRGIFRLEWAIDRKLFAIGAPSGLEMLSRNGAQFLTLKFISTFGTVAVAAIGIGMRLMGFAFMPLIGLMSGSGTIVGQNIGAGNISRADKTARTASLLGGGLMTVLFLIVMVVPGGIMRIFVTDASVVAAGIPMIRIVSFGLVAAGLTFGLASVFTGSGHLIPFTVSSIISRWGFQIPFLFVLITLFRGSLNSVWISFMAADIIELFIIVLSYRRGKWRSMRV